MEDRDQDTEVCKERIVGKPKLAEVERKLDGAEPSPTPLLGSPPSMLLHPPKATGTPLAGRVLPLLGLWQPPLVQEEEQTHTHILPLRSQH